MQTVNPVYIINEKTEKVKEIVSEGRSKQRCIMYRL